MDILTKICREYFKGDEREATHECTAQCNKCNDLYNALYKELTPELQPRLLKLSDQYFILHGIGGNDSFNDGVIKGFRLAVRLLLNVVG